MKRSQEDTLLMFRNVLFQALLHLVRGLIGKRETENTEVLACAGLQETRDPAGQYASLAGARSGQQQHRPAVPLSGLALDFAQALPGLSERFVMHLRTLFSA